MNATPISVPGLGKLYWCDFTIRRSINAALFGVLLAVGIYFVSRPVSPEAPPSVEALAAPWVSLGGLVITGIALLLLLNRYLLVRSILTGGVVVKATAEDLEAIAIRTNDSQTTIAKPAYRHSHYANFRYELGGTEYRVTIKLPNSGFTYGIVKGKETDLVVLGSRPKKPLVRAVYASRI